jgi:hypothetical protein
VLIAVMPGAWSGVKDGLIDVGKTTIVLGIGFVVVGYIIYRYEERSKQKKKKQNRMK